MGGSMLAMLAEIGQKTNHFTWIVKTAEESKIIGDGRQNIVKPDLPVNLTGNTHSIKPMNFLNVVNICMIMKKYLL